MISTITKRDGRQVPFNLEKIAKAIYKAAESVGGGNYEVAEDLAEKVEASIMADIIGRSPSVEEVQDIVEKTLIENGHAKTAKAYILYRAERTRVRESNASLMKIYEDLTFNSAIESDVKRENANINGDTAMGTMLKYGSEGAKKFNNLNVLDPRHAKAHIEGDIHVHDLDFYTLTTTCCQIDLKKLFDKGFSTGHGHLRTPNSIQSYAALACIAIQSNQNDQHGGQSIPEFDYYMAEGVAKTFRSNYVLNLARILSEKIDEDYASAAAEDYEELASVLKQNMRDIMGETGKKPRYNPDATLRKTSKENDDYYEVECARMNGTGRLAQYFNVSITDEDLKRCQLRAECLAESETNRATYQAMEALVHNLNTMNSRAGAQVPFSSINYGTDTSPEGRLVVKNLLLATQAGLGDGETPIFPVQIYKVKDGVNYEKDDPNYDLFKLAMETSAKRMFPNFSFIDAPFNLKYYDGTPDSEVAYMGCVQGSEIVTYTINGELYVEGIGRAWKRLAKMYNVQKVDYVNRTGAAYIDLEKYNVTIYDSHNERFVKVKKWITNPNMDNWVKLRLSNGRCLTATSDHPLPTRDRGRTHIKDLSLGYDIPVTYKQHAVAPMQPIRTEDKSRPMTNEMAWLAGFMLCASDYDGEIRIDLGGDNGDIEGYVNHSIAQFGLANMSTRIVNGHKVMDMEPSCYLKEHRKKLAEFFGGWGKSERQIPNRVFSWTRYLKISFLAGMLDASGRVNLVTGVTSMESVNKEMMLQQMALFQSIGVPVKHFEKTTVEGDVISRIEVGNIDEVIEYMQAGQKIRAYKNTKHEDIIPANQREYARVIGIEFVDIDECSYDVETESDRFDVSGIKSHNCRTRVMGNVHDKTREITPSRGNLSFTTINLPRLAIEHGDNIDDFYDALDDMMELVSDQLLHRFRIIAQKTPRNFPFLMAQGVWIDSDKLNLDDKLEGILKHGTLSIGFIGLAETLVLLTGKHHGESEDAQRLGLEIVSHMREYCDRKSEKTKLNFTLLATPAEGLSGRFIAIDKKRYGEIPGVTDKDFYTNSFHVPVYYEISAFKKIKIEAPYHELTNAGHISYVEMDGDPTKNIQAFEQVIRCMHDSGIGYGAINHPIDRDPACGYNGIIDDECPCCHRHETEVIVERIPRPDFTTRKRK